jgi:hypothetical protein
VSKLGRKVGNGDTLAHLDACVAVPQVVRVEVWNTCRLASSAMTFLATSGEKPWKTRRSGVRSSGGHVAVISPMAIRERSPIARAVAVFALPDTEAAFCEVNVPPFEIAELADTHPSLLEEAEW